MERWARSRASTRSSVRAGASRACMGRIVHTRGDTNAPPRPSKRSCGTAMLEEFPVGRGFVARLSRRTETPKPHLNAAPSRPTMSPPQDQCTDDRNPCDEDEGCQQECPSSPPPGHAGSAVKPHQANALAAGVTHPRDVLGVAAPLRLIMQVGQNVLVPPGGAPWASTAADPGEESHGDDVTRVANRL